MGFHRGHFFSALAGGVIAVMLLSALPGLAKNGDNMILGQKNNALTPTKLVSRGGMVLQVGIPDRSALTLVVIGDEPPMKVNSTGLVANLNADLLDGLEAAAFAVTGHDHDVDYLAVDGTADDSDLLDGRDSADFAASAQRCPYGWTAAGFDTDGGIHCGGFVTLDETGDVGSDPSMVLDASGYPVIAYGGGGNLKLARCHDAYCMSITVKTVDSDPLTHRWKSLALDASGYPVISYYDDTNHILKLAHCSDATCTTPATITTVDDSGVDMGAHNSMVLDASGYPVIAYTDYANLDLKVAHCDDANCVSKSLETVASAVFTGEYTSIALDGSGYPIIAYYEEHPGRELRVAHCVDADCAGAATINVVDTDGPVGQYASMVLDASGYPVISYFGDVDENLRLAHCSDVDCSGTVAVNTVASDGFYPSVVLDASGFPMIVYRDYTDDEMELAVCGDANCASVTIYQIDTRSGSGMGTSMALLNGFPVIAHYDFTGGDLEIVFP